MTAWYLSCQRYTICVVLDERQIIVAAPPIARRWLGRHGRELRQDMERWGGFRAERLMT